MHLMSPAKRRAPQAEVDAVIRAQRQFYECGGYEAQRESLAVEVVRALSGCPDGNRGEVLGAGCGEGAYLRAVATQLSDGAGLWGTDSEKLAVRYAARRLPAAQFAVASPHRLPFEDGSLDVVFAAFAPAVSARQAWKQRARAGHLSYVSMHTSPHMHSRAAPLAHAHVHRRTGVPRTGAHARAHGRTHAGAHERSLTRVRCVPLCRSPGTSSAGCFAPAGRSSSLEQVPTT